MTNKTDGEKLYEKLGYTFKNIANVNHDDIEEAEKFSKGYKEFLNAGKTERECVNYTEKKVKEAGYTPFDKNAHYSEGDKVYYVNRGKNIVLITFGKRPVADGVKFNIAHIDSPRLDLKPNPLYEQDELAFFKTHYYGGIKKYQWGTTPLSMHGVVILKDGTKVEIALGEKDEDPKFLVSDLLPHLAANQSERPLKEGLRGEELNIVLGSIPYQDEAVKEPVKLTALSILNEMYGITEADFMRAEIEMVPAVKATDVGLDRSLIGAYGQDDRVCAYTSLMAALSVEHPEYTTVTVMTDKEEVGSDGNTGMASQMLNHLMEDICDMYGVKARDVYRKSICLSSDVNAAYDPNFPDVFEKQNSCFLNHGPVLTKYTGSRGKGGSNDASAETMAKVIKYMDDEQVVWQIGELGKVDAGGGGTIALFMGNMNVDTVDLGVPVLAMHSPFEVTSKLDVYYTYKAFRAFCK